ncbi:aminomethyl-transferring glycine dehydrogenase subunit GcvPA [Candidatus Hikarchaeum yamanae]|uniref:aminomethyl-transferring glycine dehydrogenase subunit GcvPA n=1 Tax=Candidatus Hikarchaeum yamanae TaxID=2675326 RepID=UPI0039E812F7|tara:strand:- start:58315 stop:59649 length:1335 start_codon:yes stop_codon:yes gene_type:complete
MTNFPSTQSPYTPHTPADVEAMLLHLGFESIEDLFNIPPSLQFSDSFKIPPRSEHEIKTELKEIFDKNLPLVEFLGHGYYSHYIPSLVDHISDRSEFLTSYTQYQPEISQGFLQVLFEYQSLIVELTGLGIANSSMYDFATSIGEAALLSGRISPTRTTILVPDILRPERLSVLKNYTSNSGFKIESYPTRDSNTDIEKLENLFSNDVSMIYIESPNSHGALEESIKHISDMAHASGSLCCLGTDPIALSILEPPSSLGIDIVVGDASVLGLPNAYGMGVGLFACRSDYLRQVPGRLVGITKDATNRRAYTLTLQTREQHIRRERATSNICTNQAWVALRTAIHAAYLGPHGLINLAKQCIELPLELSSKLDTIEGVYAPLHSRHYFREFVVRTDKMAMEVVQSLETKGYAVSAIGDHELLICVTDTNASHIDAFVDAFKEVNS